MASRFLKNRIAIDAIKHLFQRSKTVTYGLQSRAFHLTPCIDQLVSFKLSDIGEGIREVTVKEWFVKVGDTVEQFQDLCEVQSDKASVTITSRYDGKILKLHHNVDEIALVGSPLIDFEVEDTSDSSDSSESETTPAEKISVREIEQEMTTFTDENSGNEARLIKLATPAVRRIAMENKINLTQVPGTGRDGRILKGDVLEFLGQIPTGTNKPHPSIAAQTQKAKSLEPIPTDRVETIKGIRKVMVKSMTESLKIPHFAYSDEVDMTNLVDFRNQLQEVAKDRGVNKLTFMPFLIKAASIALKHYPIINSSFDAEKETITYKGAHNISIAIDTPLGLAVPNVKNCQQKTVVEIAIDVNGLIERGRAGTLTPNDFVDGTFSLSNIGVIGGTYTHPCIMAPQVAIGAVGRTKPVPRFNDKDELVKAYIMNVSWCADHRVIDGVTMASFSNLWKKHLENPALFLLQ